MAMVLLAPIEDSRTGRHKNDMTVLYEHADERFAGT